MSTSNTISGEAVSQASTSSSYPFSDEFPQLLDKHLDHLKASAISIIDVIKERGYESVLGKKRLADLSFSKAQQRTPGLLCPGWSVDGQQIGCQYRPDHPRDDHNLGWSRMAEVYRKLTGEYVSRDTMKRRYLEAKRQIKDSLEAPANESLR